MSGKLTQTLKITHFQWKLIYCRVYVNLLQGTFFGDLVILHIVTFPDFGRCASLAAQQMISHADGCGQDVDKYVQHM